MPGGFGDWLDERSGYRALLSAFLDEPVAGGARLRYVFGSVLVFLLLLQAVTGVLLASSYSPSAAEAWASVAYVQQQVTLGWFIRGLHSTGASAMVILMILHLLQVTVHGAYRRPRELNWYVGLLLIGCVFAFALTGYLLPWDQKGYWATQVATNLLGALPALVAPLKRLLIGGDEYGNLTLTHFFTLHALVLPALTLLLVAVHVALFRRHGITPGWRQGPDELARRTVPFWPHQLVLDLLAMALVFALVVASVLRTHGAPLEAPADPTSIYDARPEWYFLPLFQLLKYFSGPMEIVAAVLAPALAMGLLATLPLTDRGPSRRPAARKLYLGAVALVLGVPIALGLLALRADRSNPAVARSRLAAAREAERALKLAKAGVPSRGALALYDNDPLRISLALYRQHCAGCHLFGGEGEQRAPDLDRWSSRDWLSAFLAQPNGPAFYGKTKVHGMKPVRGDAAELDALVEWIYSLGGAEGVDAAKAARGRARFEDRDCDSCHSLDGTSEGASGAPNLGGRATAAWIKALLRDPGAPHFFGKNNDMPRFASKLSEAELDALAQLLRAQRAPSPGAADGPQ